MTPLTVWLALIPVGEVSDPVALRDLGSSDPAVRLRAVARIEQLGADGPPEAGYLAGLVPLLREKDVALRGLAALAIDRHAAACKDAVSDGVVAGLVERLDDESPHVARFCARSLLALGHLALPEVGRLLGRADADRRRAVEASRLLARVARCRGPLQPLLWRAMTDPDAAVAERARQGLVALNGDPTLPLFRDRTVVLTALASPNEAIRELALKQSAAIRRADRAAEPPSPLVAPSLAERVAQMQRPSSRLLEELSFAVYAPRDANAREAVRLLRLALERQVLEPDQERVTLLALEALAAGLRDDDSAVREDCVRALAACGLPAETVLAGLLRDRDATIQLRALWVIAIMAETHRIFPTETLPYLGQLMDAPQGDLRDLARRLHGLLQPHERRNP